MRRQLLILLLVAGELVLAGVVLHLPDVGAAGGFFGGGYPTGVTTLAACTLLIWSALLISASVLAVRALRHLPAGVRSARLVVALMVAVGATVLGAGVVRHHNASYSMCCGSISQARQQLANAP
jgi:membrane protein implicated in regulation of membrane protease activity